MDTDKGSELSDFKTLIFINRNRADENTRWSILMACICTIVYRFEEGCFSSHSRLTETSTLGLYVKFLFSLKFPQCSHIKYTVFSEFSFRITSLLPHRRRTGSNCCVLITILNLVTNESHQWIEIMVRLANLATYHHLFGYLKLNRNIVRQKFNHKETWDAPRNVLAIICILPFSQIDSYKRIKTKL